MPKGLFSCFVFYSFLAQGTGKAKYIWGSNSRENQNSTLETWWIQVKRYHHLHEGSFVGCNRIRGRSQKSCFWKFDHLVVENKSTDWFLNTKFRYFWNWRKSLRI